MSLYLLNFFPVETETHLRRPGIKGKDLWQVWITKSLPPEVYVYVSLSLLSPLFSFSILVLSTLLLVLADRLQHAPCH
jgi:hypothetical protein